MEDLQDAGDYITVQCGHQNIVVVKGRDIFVIVVAIILGFLDPTNDQTVYETLKDLIPLIFAIPLGYLGFCFNSRRAFIGLKKG